jgi:3-oxoacyl-[acyl-carrier-protein] synthase II
MNMSGNDVVITGIGIVSSLGIGREAHEALFDTGNPLEPVIDTERFAPYPVHPLPEIDWSAQIPRRGDQRQMENWQRIGVFTAGLALDDAGFKDDAEACSSMDMIAAAGGGERDISVDTLIINEAAVRNDRDLVLNEKLTTELRPTLFLAQLSNLLAGNISIVHKVTGSSKTFMGEESAGVSAVSTVFEKIRAGQASHALVGGAYNAERIDMQLVFEGTQSLAQGDWKPIWSRTGNGAGVISGSASAFLVLESRDHAVARGARIHARLEAVEGDRGRREDGGMEQRLGEMADRIGIDDSADVLVLSGASGERDVTAREKAFLESRYHSAALRGYSGLIGHAMEAQFPLGIAIAAMALRTGTRIAEFDPAAERPMPDAAAKAVVTTVGFIHGEGLAALSADTGR